MQSSNPRKFFDSIDVPMEKLSTLFALVPLLDDAAVPRGRLVTFMYIVADYYEEIAEAINLYARDADYDDDGGDV